MMMKRAENLDTARLLGYLVRDNVLYCSQECASKVGQADAAAVDQDEYQALVDRGSLSAAVVCPVCGSEYPLDWSADDER